MSHVLPQVRGHFDDKMSHETRAGIPGRTPTLSPPIDTTERGVTTSMSHTLTDQEAQELIDIGCSHRELVRLRWPDADDDLADFILWERTPFPIVSGVHDIADLLVDINERQCGSLAYGGICRRRVSTAWTPCWQHRARPEASE